MERLKNLNTKNEMLKRMYLKEIERAKSALLTAKTPREIRALQQRIRYLESLLREIQ
ncbi:MAG: hypothetical protein QW197_00830 [Candidatus Aenigmatarchaeota archaeon]